MKKVWHFLGGVRFAIILITLATLSVILGTFLESYADSHGFASSWIYSHPFFMVLLSGFFINILISALRRYPFKRKHIPFLITHLGLLMIIAGTLVKNIWGTQGSLSIHEGSFSHSLYIPESYALRIETHDTSKDVALKKDFWGTYSLNDPEITFLRFIPHAQEKLLTWIKKDRAQIQGFPPIPVHEWKPGQLLPPNTQTLEWDIIALRTNDVEEAIEAGYHDGLSIDGAEGLPVTFNLDYHPTKGFIRPRLIVDDNIIHLSGPQALLNSFGIDLKRKPRLMLIEDLNGDMSFIAFDAHGRVFSDLSLQGQLSSLIAYADGYMGYATQTSVPFWPFPSGRIQLEQARRRSLENQLKNNTNDLSPPLKLLAHASQKLNLDFPTTCLDFLTHWDKTRSWLFPANTTLPAHLEDMIENIDLSKIPPNELKATHWCVQLFDTLEPLLATKQDLIEILRESKWPLIPSLEAFRGRQGPVTPDELPRLLTWISQRLYSVADILPPAPEGASKVRLLTAYLRAYEIHLQQIHRFKDHAEIDALLRESQPSLAPSPIVFETPLSPSWIAYTPPIKKEDLRPLISFKYGNRIINLGFDPQGVGLKWPLVGGHSVIRFQPQFHEIPYSVRMRQAKQVNYPNSNQPHSYEADVVIQDRRTKEIFETTLKMNQVHETWDGYRFYLSGMSPGDETAVKRVQIVVNHDPVKYFLTYPGAMILALGIVLLFWKRKNGTTDGHR